MSLLASGNKSMKRNYTIGFDARYANVEGSTIGTYSRLMVEALATACPEECYARMYIPRRRTLSEFKALDEQHNIEAMEPDGLFWRKLPWAWHLWGIGRDAERGDVALYHGLAGELPVGLARRNIRSVVSVHDLSFLRLRRYHNPIERTLRRLKLLHTLHLADRIVAVSENLKRDLVRYLKIDPDKIDVIYCGCDHSYTIAPTDMKIAEVREKYALPKRYILNVGEQSERGNQSLIIEAMAQLDEDINLVLVGSETSYTRLLLRRAKSLGMRDRIHIINTHSTDELAAIYSEALLLAHTALYDGFATQIVEAENIGTPVIATKGSSMEEAGGSHSLYVNAENHEELAAAIERVVGDPILRHNMVERGKEYVHRFRGEVIAYNLINCYKRINIDLMH